jgi:hypothetical protein
MEYEFAAACYVRFQSQYPLVADKFSVWYPFLLTKVTAALAQRPHLTWIRDPTFICELSEIIPDRLPCYSYHIVNETLSVVSAYVQLTQHPERCLWHDPSQGRLLLGYTPIARVDLDWQPPSTGLRVLVNSNSSLSVWFPGGLWIGFHVLLLGWPVTYLTRLMVTHSDGDCSNYRKDNLRVLAARGGEVRQIYCLPTGALRVTVHGKSVSSKIRDDGPWETLGRLLHRFPGWHDFRGNITGQG